MQPVFSGKVRDLYDLPDGRLLLVASDRISAFDFVLPTPIPDKGRVLTAMSLWWFERLADLLPNHVISTDVPRRVRRSGDHLRAARDAAGRVRRPRLPGRLGSDRLPARRRDLRRRRCRTASTDGSRLPHPIFTPATKAEQGEHDENVSFDEVVVAVGAEVAATLREITLRVYERGEAIARERGIILADTKIEIGTRPDGTLVLADEVLTPDSSRFWPAEQWQPGRPQPSFDKQYVRDWLTSPESGWDRSVRRAAAAAPRRRRRAHPGALRRGVRADHGTGLRLTRVTGRSELC